jgi:predicted nuclease with TOPRIM domain
MTSQEIREANNSFPSKVRETYDAAANRIDELELIITRLRKALEEETENSAAYEGENSRLWSMLQKLLKNLPGSSTAYMEIEREMKGL